MSSKPLPRPSNPTTMSAPSSASTRRMLHAGEPESPRHGRDMLAAREAAVLASVAKVETTRLSPIFIDGDRSAIHWRFEFTPKDNGPAEGDGGNRAADLARQRADRGALLLRSGPDEGVTLGRNGFRPWAVDLHHRFADIRIMSSLAHRIRTVDHRHEPDSWRMDSLAPSRRLAPFCAAPPPIRCRATG